MSHTPKTPQHLTIDALDSADGPIINVNGENFPVIYSDKVWSKTTDNLKAILRDTLALASTLYLPQILNLREAHYKTARPISECFFLRNGIYDAPYCANVDGKSSIDYLRNFYNTQYLFASEKIKTPYSINFENKNKKSTKRALILFSAGKESLLSFALCRELGIDTVLVSVIHPGFVHEWKHKEPLIKAFEKEFNTTVHTIQYEPGILKEGKHWKLSTELGWGLHVTEYALLALPYAEVFDCDFIVCGNEQSCNDIYFDQEDVLIYRAGLDQHKEWTTQQGLLQSLLIGRSLPAHSLLEPLYEITEMKLLHGRYPEVGKYQMSCSASSDGALQKRWCEECEKCAYMYALLRAFDIDPALVGFKSNLFDEAHKDVYETFFTRTEETHYYGNQGELGIGFYLFVKNYPENTDHSIVRFKKELLDTIEKNLAQLKEKYLSVHNTDHFPPEFAKTLFTIFTNELSSIR